MDLKFKDSDIFLSDWGEYSYLEGVDEVLQRAVLCALIPKGAFIYNKELGTELNDIDADDSRSVQTATVLLNEAFVGTIGAKAEVTSLEKKSDGSVKLKLSVSYMGETKQTEVVLSADI